MRLVYIGGDPTWGRRRCSYCGKTAFLCIQCIEVASDQIDLVEEVLTTLDPGKDELLVTTDLGVSSFVGVEAKSRGFLVTRVRTDLNYYGARAAAIRDTLILSYPPEKVIILHDHLEEDPDLMRFVGWARAAAIPVEVRGLPKTSVAAPIHPPPSPLQQESA